VLLDRRRVKFWQKWVFGFMAVIMAAFLVMIPVNRGLGCGGSTTSSATKQLTTDIAKYQAAAKAKPKSVDAWQSLGDAYASRANQTSDAAGQKADFNSAAAAYAHVAKLYAAQKGADAKLARLNSLKQLANVYDDLKDYEQETAVYGEITTLTPKDPQAYFEMATAAINASETNIALLAFNRFLELDPKSPDAQGVKDWIKSNAPSPAPTKGSGK
jgi:tetratricopeptide (TPR) repeat protein